MSQDSTKAPIDAWTTDLGEVAVLVPCHNEEDTIANVADRRFKPRFRHRRYVRF